jgi:hypothetical protein
MIFFFGGVSAAKKKLKSSLRPLRLERICQRQIKRAVKHILSPTRKAKMGPSR